MNETFNSLYMNQPPAIVRAAFDEARAIAEIKLAVASRDVSKGEYQDAILLIGQKLIEARRAMPGTMVGGQESYSPAFLAFVEKTGLAKGTAVMYMGYARDPRKLEAKRLRDNSNPIAQRRRRKVLTEVREMLTKCENLDDAITTIEEELNEIK